MEGNHKERPLIESADGDKPERPPPRLSRLEKPPLSPWPGAFPLPAFNLCALNFVDEGSRITKLL
jgi:hypothetical protein